MYVQDFPEEVNFTIGAEVTVLTAIMGRVRLISEALTPIPGEISQPVVKVETDFQLICQNVCWISGGRMEYVSTVVARATHGELVGSEEGTHRVLAQEHFLVIHQFRRLQYCGIPKTSLKREASLRPAMDCKIQ